MRRARATRPPSAAEWDELIVPRAPAAPRDSPAPAPRAVKLAARAGLPAPLRRRAWTAIAGVDAEARRSAGVYEAFVEKATRLMEDQREERSVLRAIEKDLKRTLPRHVFYVGVDGKRAPAGDVVEPTGIPSGNEEVPHEILVALRRVLYAYTIHDNEVGYCQGMNFVAAMFLSFLSEEESFWMLAAVMNARPYEMRGLFAKDMAGVHEKLYVAKRVVQKFLPKLHKHLVNENVDLSMFVLEWMLTIFTSTFPLDLVSRVWDSFIVEGWKAVYRAMLSLLERAQRDLLRLGMERIIFYLKDEFPSKVDGPAVFEASLKIPLRQKHVRKYTAEWRDAKPATPPADGDGVFGRQIRANREHLARKERERKERERKEEEEEQRRQEEADRRMEEAMEKARLDQEAKEKARSEREAKEKSRSERESKEDVRSEREAKEKARSEREVKDEARSEWEAEEKAGLEREAEEKASLKRDAEGAAKKTTTSGGDNSREMNGPAALPQGEKEDNEGTVESAKPAVTGKNDKNIHGVKAAKPERRNELQKIMCSDVKDRYDELIQEVGRNEARLAEEQRREKERELASMENNLSHISSKVI